MGRKSGELIILSDRKNYCGLIETACSEGAKQKDACEIIGITARTFQRWTKSDSIVEDQRLNNKTPTHNKLPESIKMEIIELINKKEYRSLTPHQINLIKRRIFNNEKIPHKDKIFSIFQPHTEWINKGKAGVPVELGLRVCIVEDASGYILNH
ncbi:hypothetical protein MNBD_UNCLBAC01-1324, partial [hydrothermal vent metagenome]